MADTETIIANAVAACPHSARIMAAGFTAKHNGGGCLHWVKRMGDGWQLWLCDPESMDLGSDPARYSMAAIPADVETWLTYDVVQGLDDCLAAATTWQPPKVHL
jgi:hypothetical protein